MDTRNSPAILISRSSNYILNTQFPMSTSPSVLSTAHRKNNTFRKFPTRIALAAVTQTGLLVSGNCWQARLGDKAQAIGQHWQALGGPSRSARENIDRPGMPVGCYPRAAEAVWDRDGGKILEFCAVMRGRLTRLCARGKADQPSLEYRAWSCRNNYVLVLFPE